MNKCLFAILCISCISSVVGKRISTNKIIDRHRQSTAAAGAGDIETALLLAQTQLEDELAKHHKKNQHEKEEKAKYEKEMKDAREIVGAWACKYFGWFVDWVHKDYCSYLENHQIPYLATQVNYAAAELRTISATIATLHTEVHQTLTSVKAARAEEGLVEKLNVEIKILGQQKEAALDANGKMEAAEKQRGDNKISAFDEEIRKLLEALKAVRQVTCKPGDHVKCPSGEMCAGDQCCLDGSTCPSASTPFHKGNGREDLGCQNAKTEDCISNMVSLLQVAASAHPLREKLKKAKAAVRKVIAAEEDKIDNLKAQLATSLQDIGAAEEAKRNAEKKFNDEIVQEQATHDLLTADQNAAESEKAHQTALLDGQKADGAEQVATLVAELEEDIKKLTADLVATEHEKIDMMEANAAVMHVMKDKHAAQINDIDIEIQKLEDEKKDARAKLDAIKKQHGLAT